MCNTSLPAEYHRELIIFWMWTVAYIYNGQREPPAIRSSSPHLCQNGGGLILSSIRETDKSRVGEERQSYCFW
jgi:hypothetical protein